MLAFELLGRLLPLVHSNGHLKNLLCGSDLEGPKFNCFLPVHHSYHTPGGPLKYSLEVYLINNKFSERLKYMKLNIKLNIYFYYSCTFV